MNADISPETRQWRNADALYLARQLEALGAGKPLVVLDMGCGNGSLLAQLADLDHDLFGYDVESDASRDERRRVLGPLFGEGYDERIRETDSEREIPFDSDFFDVVHANQVFEHLPFLDAMLAECSRVLKPGGVLLANFPLATNPMELHLRLPFAHWMPPGRTRLAYLRVCARLGILRPWLEGTDEARPSDPAGSARSWDRYLRDFTYYRFMNEFVRVATAHFETCEIDTKAFVTAKLDLMAASGRPRQTMLARLIGSADRGDLVTTGITHFVNAAFKVTGPRKA